MRGLNHLAQAAKRLLNALNRQTYFQVRIGNGLHWITAERWLHEQKDKHLNKALTGGFSYERPSARHDHEIRAVEVLPPSRISGEEKR